MFTILLKLQKRHLLHFNHNIMPNPYTSWSKPEVQLLLQLIPHHRRGQNTDWVTIGEIIGKTAK